MDEYTPIQKIYYTLGLPLKIGEKSLRIMYLRHVWGLEQKHIAACEKISQSSVSSLLSQYKKKTPMENVYQLAVLQFTVEDIKALHLLPREILNDVQLVALVNNMLGIQISTPFYIGFGAAYKNNDYRIRALHELGVRQQQLGKIFGKTQPAISQSLKRTPPPTMELIGRYTDINSPTFKIDHRVTQKSLKSQIMGGKSL